MVDKVAFIFDSSFPESLSVCQSEQKADFELVQAIWFLLDYGCIPMSSLVSCLD